MADNKPEDTLRDRDIKATIWRNEGEKGPYFTVALAKTYQDDKGKYHDTNNFSGTDLLRVAEISREAYRVTNEMRREHYQSLEAEQSRGDTRGRASGEFDQRARTPRTRGRNYGR